MLTVLCFFSLFTFSRIARAGEWVFDFEDPKQADRWKAANGSGKIQKGVYAEISATEKAAHTLFGEADWTDYTVEAKIRIDANRWAGLVFRAVSEYEYYIVYPEPTPGVSAFFQHHGKDWATRAQPNPNKTQIKGKIQVGNWCHLKIEVKRNDLKWFIDDPLQAETKLERVGDLDVYKKVRLASGLGRQKRALSILKFMSLALKDPPLSHRRSWP